MDPQSASKEDLLNALPLIFGKITDASLINPLLDDLELVMPLCGLGVLVESKQLKHLRAGVASSHSLSDAWILTLWELNSHSCSL